MSRPLWFVRLLKAAFPGRSLMARATHVPIMGSLIDHMLFEGDHLIYLPKDETIQPDALVQIDEQVNLPGEMVVPSRVVEHFIREAGTHW
nr:4Fe-4S ferredoxin [Stutzerimonas stutzeri]